MNEVLHGSMLAGMAVGPTVGAAATVIAITVAAVVGRLTRHHDAQIDGA